MQTLVIKDDEETYSTMMTEFFKDATAEHCDDGRAATRGVRAVYTGPSSTFLQVQKTSKPVTSNFNPLKTKLV
jgi:hypothetical protein